MTVPLKRPFSERSPVTYSNSRTTDWLNVVLSGILNRAPSAQARQLPVAADGSVIPLVYGEDQVGGLVLNVVPSGVNVLVQVVWALQGDSVNDIKYNDLALPSGASATSYDGSQVAVDSALATAFSGHSVTYTDTLAGYMYSVITMPQSTFSGSLAFSARIKGRKCYDPRTGTTVWTDCPSLHLCDFLESTAYGCGKTVDRGGGASVATAATANDALVGGSEKRRLSGLAFIAQQPVETIAEILRAHAGVFLTPPGATGIKFVVDTTRATDATYTHSSGQIAQLVSLTKKDTGNVPTVVEVIYTDTTVFPWRDGRAVVESSGIDVTVPRRTSTVRMPGVQRHTQAKREATERLNKLRTTDLEIVVDVFDQGIAHEAGDVIEVTHPVGITSKKFRIADPELVGAGIWRLTGTEYDSANYSDGLVAAPTYADTNLTNASTVPPNLTNFSVAVLADGTRRFTITAPTGAPTGSKIMVRSVTGSSSTWSAMAHLFMLEYNPAQATYYHETSLPIEGTWSFGVKLVNVFGTECATAVFITAAVLSTHPKRYDATFNMIKNADWTASFGSQYDYPNSFTDARALPSWTAVSNVGTANFWRNFYGGQRWNVGAGGCAMSWGTYVSGGNCYLYQDVPVTVSGTDTVYEASVYVAVARTRLNFLVQWFGTAGYLSSDMQGGADDYTLGTATTVGDPYNPLNNVRLFRYGTAPSNATKARVVLLQYTTTTGQVDSVSFWHKSQLCKWGGGTSAAEALPWVPPTGVETGGVNTGNLGANAATEVYTAASSGTGNAMTDTTVGTSVTFYTWSDQSCSVSVPVEVGDKLSLYAEFIGDAGDLPATRDYATVALDLVTPGGSGTVWYSAGSPTGNLVRKQNGAGANTTARSLNVAAVYSMTTAGTATAYAGGAAGFGSTAPTYTESGQVKLRVERIKR